MKKKYTVYLEEPLERELELGVGSPMSRDKSIEVVSRSREKINSNPKRRALIRSSLSSGTSVNTLVFSCEVWASTYYSRLVFYNDVY